jgi:hypothetical protein
MSIEHKNGCLRKKDAEKTECHILSVVKTFEFLQFSRSTKEIYFVLSHNSRTVETTDKVLYWKC